MSFTFNPVLKLVLPIWRSRLILVCLLLGFVALMARALYLQVLHNDFLQIKGKQITNRVLEISASRGKITDRNGEPLAISTPVKSIWAIPSEVEITLTQVQQLSKLLEIPVFDIQKRLKDTQRDFIFLKRQIPPTVADKVSALGIPGIFEQREYRRYYPQGEVTAHIVGFTNVDDNGQEGIELAYQEVLAGRPGSRRVIKNRFGQIIEDVESIKAPKEGMDVVLSLDSRIQHLAVRYLREAINKHKAKAGGVVVIDVKTGEILALANFPTYNPNNRSNLTGAQLRNRVLTDAFEPGSTLKPFTVALALESGKVRPQTIIQTAPGKLEIGKYVISDVHKNNALSIIEVIQKSSNVGTAKLALSLDPEDMWNNFHEMGFGQAPQIKFPGVTSGRLRPYKSWKPIEQATMSYGHGISVSLIQLARAYMLFARNGELIPISLTKQESLPIGVSIISRQTAQQMKTMLEKVVEPGGTALGARVAGYRVAGKTGTAHKLDGDRYASDRYISSFVGFAPVSDPRVIVAIMIDEASSGQYYGGTVAAPVFSQVMLGVLRVLNIPPDASDN